MSVIGYGRCLTAEQASNGAEAVNRLDRTENDTKLAELLEGS